MHDVCSQDDNRILSYTTDDNIGYLGANTISHTFEEAPTQFTQLFTVQDVVLGYTMPRI